MDSAIDLTGEDDYIYTTKTPGAREVNVKLMSLDGELDRDIYFSDKIGLLTIAVGRASKNVVRGMFPQRGNAWIESPVMSRNHAQLYVEPGNDRAVFIKDLDSTHGTKVNGQRLTPKKRSRLMTGDKISLGSAVRAGLNEFKPKEFQVRLDWKKHDASPIVLTPSPSTEHNPQSRTYSVPSPGDSDYEDGEDLYGNTPLGEEKEFTITMERQVEQPSSSLHEKQVVVDLSDNEVEGQDDTVHEKKGQAESATVLFSNTSDDEAPKILPNTEALLINGWNAHCSKPTVTREFALHYESDSDSSDSDYVPEVSLSGHAENGTATSPPYSPEVPKSPSYSPSSPVYSPTIHILRESTPDFIEGKGTQGAIDGWFDQTDDIDVYDELDDEQDEAHSIEYPTSSSSEASDSHGSDMSESDENDDPNESDDAASVAPNDEQYPRDEDVRKDLNHLSTLISDIDGNAPIQATTTNAPRVPSPSDAALARSSSTIQAVKASQYLPIPGYDHQDGADTALNSSISSSGPAMINNQLGLNEGSCKPPSSQAQDFLGFSMAWENQDAAPKPAYSQGPFAIPEDYSNSEARSLSTLPLNNHNNFGYCGYMPYPGSRPFDPLYGPSCIREDPTTLISSKASWPTVNTEPTNVVQDNEQNGCDLPPPTRPSRLRISQLVNETPETVTSTEKSNQSLKRKADRISTAEHDSEPSHSYTTSADEPHMSSSCKEDSFAQQNNDCNNTALSGTEIHDHMETGLTFGSSEVSTIATGLHNTQTERSDGEPPSTRARTEGYRPNSRRAWFWKAATHTAAGVLGAVAFAAAMIATVPDDIKNEAFAEY